MAANNQYSSHGFKENGKRDDGDVIAEITLLIKQYNR